MIDDGELHYYFDIKVIHDSNKHLIHINQNKCVKKTCPIWDGSL